MKKFIVYIVVLFTGIFIGFVARSGYDKQLLDLVDSAHAIHLDKTLVTASQLRNKKTEKALAGLDYDIYTNLALISGSNSSRANSAKSLAKAYFTYYPATPPKDITAILEKTTPITIDELHAKEDFSQEAKP